MAAPCTTSANFRSGGSTYLTIASADKTVRLWDPTTEECVRVITGHTDWVNTVRSVPSLHGDLLASQASAQPCASGIPSPVRRRCTC
ncbi:hypothetical protein [Streptomyces sp. PKU-EA00015]|uniref:hypothetical protein n=1 Tax=Streptomyces sp. PKU-EA00015 TaxID=2748326 RepID=UPI0035C83D51